MILKPEKFKGSGNVYFIFLKFWYDIINKTKSLTQEMFFFLTWQITNRVPYISDKVKSGDDTILLDYEEVSKNIDKELQEQSAPFTCPYCGAICSLKGNLKKHILTRHTNIPAEEKKRLQFGQKDLGTYVFL